MFIFPLVSILDHYLVYIHKYLQSLWKIWQLSQRVCKSMVMFFFQCAFFCELAPCLIFNDDVLQLLQQKLMYFVSPYTLNFEPSSCLFLCYLFSPSMSFVFHNSSDIYKKCAKLCNNISNSPFAVGFVVVGLCCYHFRHYNNVLERNFHLWEYLKVQNS